MNSPQWTKVGLGTGTLASLGRAISTSQADRLISSMADLGIRVIDTADAYGSGDCEHLLGKVLPGRRENFTLATKAGYRHANLKGPFRCLNQFFKKLKQRTGPSQCFDAEYLTMCVEQSLERLKTDYLDAFLLHNPSLHDIQEDVTLSVLQRIKSTGKALTVGISSSDLRVLTEAVRMEGIDVVQTPASLDLAERLSPIWKAFHGQGIHIIGNHVFNPACLSRPGASHEPLMRASAALLPASATILCGTRNPSHLAQSNLWAQSPMGEDEARSLAEGFASPATAR
jgi:aryl-alcohol dehydrogenase-like predicted oxidoreductase